MCAFKTQPTAGGTGEAFCLSRSARQQLTQNKQLGQILSWLGFNFVFSGVQKKLYFHMEIGYRSVFQQVGKGQGWNMGGYRLIVFPRDGKEVITLEFHQQQRQAGMSHLADPLLPITPSTEGSLTLLFVRASVSNLNKEQSEQPWYLQGGSRGVTKFVIPMYFQGLRRADVWLKEFGH